MLWSGVTVHSSAMTWELKKIPGQIIASRHVLSRRDDLVRVAELLGIESSIALANWKLKNSQ